MRARRYAVLATALVGGCIASNVVAPAARIVEAEPANLPFVPATGELPAGLYESVDLRGEAAAALRRIWYVFEADGAYTGAALAEVEGHFAFQTLSGRWRLDGSALVLDDGDPVQLELAPGHLRLAAPTGVLVLRQAESQ